MTVNALNRFKYVFANEDTERFSLLARDGGKSSLMSRESAKQVMVAKVVISYRSNQHHGSPYAVRHPI